MIKIKKTNQLEKERIKKKPAIDFLITEKRAHFKKEENTEKSGQLYAISLFGPSINSITSLLGLFIWAKLGLWISGVIAMHTGKPQNQSPLK